MLKKKIDSNLLSELQRKQREERWGINGPIGGADNRIVFQDLDKTLKKMKVYKLVFESVNYGTER